MSNVTTTPLPQNTTAAPPSPSQSTTEADSTTEEFLIVAGVTCACLILFFGSLIICCKRMILHTSKRAKEERSIKERAQDESLGKEVWSTLEAERKRELVVEQAKMNRGVELIDIGVPLARVEGGSSGSGSDLDDEVGYADFHGAQARPEHYSTVLEPLVFNAEGETNRLPIPVRRGDPAAKFHKSSDILAGMEVTTSPRKMVALQSARVVTAASFYQAHSRTVPDPFDFLGEPPEAPDNQLSAHPFFRFGPRLENFDDIRERPGAPILPWHARAQEEQMLKEVGSAKRKGHL